MPEQQGGLRQKVDDFFTNYLRNTTSDQEILDFYGEGNIIGRKGIDPSTVVNEAFDAYKLPGQRPRVERVIPKSDQLFGLPGGEESIVNINNALDPKTANPWQMKFETLPFPAEGTPTSAATRFLKDFRVPTGTAVDYGFETAPNVKDVNAVDTNELVNDPRNYKNARAAYLAEDSGTPISESGPLSSQAAERLETIKARTSAVTRPSAKLATPTYWSSRGFELPDNLKQATLNTFKEQILQSENPFGSVSQLTPVKENAQTLRPGGDVDWRANLYEKTGLAGPMTNVHVAGAYGGSSADVQMFTRGNERLLPIQPYTEFYGGFDASKPSALNTAPAADFTPFQKTVGTRNYLIGRNILEGRGNLGEGFRGATGGLAAGAALGALSPEVSQALVQGDYKEAAGLTARDALIGAGTNLGARAVSQGLQRAAPQLAARVLPAIGSTASVAVPAAVGAGLFMQGRQGSPLNKLVNAASNTPFGLKVNPKTDVGRLAGRAISNEAQYAWNQIMKGKLPWMGR